MRRPNVCFIVTDSISFQMLCRGQFEYFQDNSDFDMTFIAGGIEENFNKLMERKVGNVFNAKFVRKPSLINDIKSLILLTHYLHRNHFDLVIYSTPKALLLGSLATSLTRHKNTVAIIRGRAYENYKGPKRKIYQLLDKVSLFSSNKVLFISKSLLNVYLEENLVNISKSYIIDAGSSNGVDTNKFKPNDKITSQANNGMRRNEVRPDQCNILIAGRVCIDKGVKDVAEVIQNVTRNNVFFTFVGPIEDTESEIIIQSLLSQYTNVKYVPYTDSIEDYFKESHLHLFLSHREGFGNVAIEAASSGVPTFCYDVIGVKDSVLDGVSGKKFKFKDTKSVIEEINKIKNVSDLKRTYPNCRDWAIENFKQEKVWNSYLRFYKNLI